MGSSLTLTVLCGPPGAGKSTYAAELPGRILSADAIRDGANAGKTFAGLYAALRAYLSRGESCIVDTCALRSDDRLPLLRAGLAAGARCELHMFETALDECRRRNAARPNPARVDWAAVRERWIETHRAVAHEGWHRVRKVRVPHG